MEIQIFSLKLKIQIAYSAVPLKSIAEANCTMRTSKSEIQFSLAYIPINLLSNDTDLSPKFPSTIYQNTSK